MCCVQRDSRQHSMARLCALLCDTASFLAQKRYLHLHSVNCFGGTSDSWEGRLLLLAFLKWCCYFTWWTDHLHMSYIATVKAVDHTEHLTFYSDWLSVSETEMRCSQILVISCHVVQNQCKKIFKRYGVFIAQSLWQLSSLLLVNS